MQLLKGQILNSQQRHGKNFYDKERLLANGDRWEDEIARNLEKENNFR